VYSAPTEDTERLFLCAHIRHSDECCRAAEDNTASRRFPTANVPIPPGCRPRSTFIPRWPSSVVAMGFLCPDRFPWVGAPLHTPCRTRRYGARQPDVMFGQTRGSDVMSTVSRRMCQLSSATQWQMGHVRPMFACSDPQPVARERGGGGGYGRVQLCETLSRCQYQMA
jgi:hypothetical protein